MIVAAPFTQDANRANASNGTCIKWFTWNAKRFASKFALLRSVWAPEVFFSIAFCIYLCAVLLKSLQLKMLSFKAGFSLFTFETSFNNSIVFGITRRGQNFPEKSRKKLSEQKREPCFLHCTAEKVSTQMCEHVERCCAKYSQWTAQSASQTQIRCTNRRWLFPQWMVTSTGVETESKNWMSFGVLACLYCFHLQFRGFENDKAVIIWRSLGIDPAGVLCFKGR